MLTVPRQSNLLLTLPQKLLPLTLPQKLLPKLLLMLTQPSLLPWSRNGETELL